MVKSAEKKRARDLRRQGWSMRDITRELNISKSSVSRWVADIPMTEEMRIQLKQNQSDNAKIGTQANKDDNRTLRQQYQDEGREKARERSHSHMMGCMLYWAEGAKDKNRLEFVNSDPHMMKLFVYFLRQDLLVPDETMLLRIHCHTTDATEIHRIETYCLDLLDLPETCLQKTFITQGSTSRKNRLENGICAIRVNSTRLVQHIYGAIQEYGGFTNDDWLG